MLWEIINLEKVRVYTFSTVQIQCKKDQILISIVDKDMVQQSNTVLFVNPGTSLDPNQIEIIILTGYELEVLSSI